MNFSQVLSEIEKGDVFKRKEWKDRAILYDDFFGLILLWTFDASSSTGIDVHSYCPAPTDLLSGDWEEIGE
jgi:hypothetical protein